MTDLSSRLARLTTEERDHTLEFMVAYLAEAGELGPLDQVFASDDWLALRFAGSQHTYQGYFADLDEAWRAWQAAAYQAIADGSGIGQSVNRCLHAALIGSSLQSTALNYHPAIICRAVALEMWPPGRALALAQRTASIKTRCALLTGLLATGRLTVDQRKRAEETALEYILHVTWESEDYDPHRWAALKPLAPHLTEERIGPALDTALTKEFRPDMAGIVVGLAPRLSLRQRDQLLSAVGQFSSQQVWAQILHAVAPNLDPTQARRVFELSLGFPDFELGAVVLNRLLKYSHRTLLPLLFERFESSTYTGQKACYLDLAAPYLTPEQLNEWWPQALAAAYREDEDDERFLAFHFLAPFLPADEKAEAEAESRRLAGQIDDPADRINALGLVAGKAREDKAVFVDEALALLPQVSDPARRADLLAILAWEAAPVQGQALLAACLALLDEDLRVYVMEVIGPHLGGPAHDQALEEALNLHDRDRQKVLAALASRMTHRSFQRLLDAAVERGWLLSTQANLLEALAPNLPDTLLDPAWRWAKEIGHPLLTAGPMAALAVRFADREQYRPMLEAIVGALVVGVDHIRDSCLERMAPAMPETLVKQLLAWRPPVPGDLVEGLRAVVELLVPVGSPSELAARCLALAKEAPNGEKRASALVVVAPLLTGSLAEEALSLGWDLDNEHQQALLLRNLAPALNGHSALETLAKAGRFSEAHDRAAVLHAFGQHGDELIWRQVWSMVRAEEKSHHQAGIIAALVDRLPDEDLAQALDVLLDIPFDDGRDRAQALGALAPRLPPTERLRALTRLDGLSDTLLDYSRSQLLCHFGAELAAEGLAAALAMTDSRFIPEALVGLAPYLDESQLAQATRFARANSGWRAAALAGLAPWLPPEEQAGAVEETLVAAVQAGATGFLGLALNSLPPLLDLEQRAQLASMLLDRLAKDEERDEDLVAAMWSNLAVAMGQSELKQWVARVQRLGGDSRMLAVVLMALLSRLEEQDELVAWLRHGLVDLLNQFRKEDRQRLFAFLAHDARVNDQIITTEARVAWARDILDMMDDWHWP